MNRIASSSLPPRLTRAIWIWLALAPVVALLPRAGAEAVGLLAHPAFWCALLPLLALLPQARQLLPESTTVTVMRKPRNSVQARRRSRPRRALRAAA